LLFVGVFVMLFLGVGEGGRWGGMRVGWGGGEGREMNALRTLHGHDECGSFGRLQIWTSSSFNKA